MLAVLQLPKDFQNVEANRLPQLFGSFIGSAITDPLLGRHPTIPKVKTTAPRQRNLKINRFVIL